MYHTHFGRENRYLLFVTENFAALEVLKDFIAATMKKMLKERDGAVENGDSAVENRKPMVLFGSSFPKDCTFTQVFKTRNTVIPI